jgi:uncharacterized protein HemY
MTAREHAEELRQQAIKTLLDEKAEIEEMLNTLGFQKEAPTKRRGRPPKAEIISEQEPLEPQPSQI